MDCLLCEKSYPKTQIECYECHNNLQTIKPYSPHLSQIIRLGERLCNGEVDPGLFQLAIKNLIKRLDIADDEYFKQEANYTKEDLIILEDMLNSILEQSEFFRHTLQELLESSKLLDIRQIYTNLDKAKISETMYLKAGEKLKNLTKEEFIELGKKKGVEIKFQD